MERIKLTLLPEKWGTDPAEGIPKYGIVHDSKFFDLPSLIRMYGKEEVERFKRTLKEYNAIFPIY